MYVQQQKQTTIMFQFEDNNNNIEPTTSTDRTNYNNTNHRLTHRRKRRHHPPSLILDKNNINSINQSVQRRSNTVSTYDRSSVGSCNFVNVNTLINVAIGTVLYIVATSMVQTEAWLSIYYPFQFTSSSFSSVSFDNTVTRRKLQTKISSEYTLFNNNNDGTSRYQHHHVRSTVKEVYSFLLMNPNLNINGDVNNNNENDMLQKIKQQKQSQTMLPNCTSTATILSDDANNRDNSDDVIKNSDLDLEIITSSSSSRLLQKQQQQSTSKSNMLLLDVGSQITQTNCQLLGIKSIGIDYGLVRTGLAVTVGYEPKPLGILYNTNSNTSNVTQLCNDIIHYIKSEQNVQQIIIGLPLHKNGTNSIQSLITLQFSILLYQSIIRSFGLSIRVVLFDERYTSKEAAARVHSKNPNIPLYGILDADSACIILENYYNDNGIGEKVLTLSNTTLLNECLHYYNMNQQQQKQQQQLLQLQQLTKIHNRLYNIQQEKQHAILIQQQQQQQQELIGSYDDPIKKKKKKKKKR